MIYFAVIIGFVCATILAMTGEGCFGASVLAATMFLQFCYHWSWRGILV